LRKRVISPANAGLFIGGTGDCMTHMALLLRNTHDDHSIHMGDPSVRGKTDRFVMRFRKPR